MTQVLELINILNNHYNSDKEIEGKMEISSEREENFRRELKRSL